MTATQRQQMAVRVRRRALKSVSICNMLSWLAIRVVWHCQEIIGYLVASVELLIQDALEFAGNRLWLLGAAVDEVRVGGRRA